MKKILALLTMFMLAIITRNIIISMHKLSSERERINSLSQNLEHEKKENQFLNEHLLYVKSDEFIEEQARNKLGMVKEGEYMIMEPQSTESAEFQTEKREEPNWKKWWRLFF